MKMAALRQNSIRPVFSIASSGRSPLVAMMLGSSLKREVIEDWLDSSEIQ
jgi:hypothetical protein